jgi:hypothetical protein
MKIRVEHCWGFGYCSRGLRQFALRHNIDWVDWVNNGVDSEKLVSTGDEMAIVVVEKLSGK